ERAREPHRSRADGTRPLRHRSALELHGRESRAAARRRADEAHATARGRLRAAYSGAALSRRRESHPRSHASNDRGLRSETRSGRAREPDGQLGFSRRALRRRPRRVLRGAHAPPRRLGAALAEILTPSATATPRNAYRPDAYRRERGNIDGAVT